MFQFESAGIVGLLKNIKPTNMEHVIAANALYRPGTLENQVAFEYSRRKNDLINWKLPHEIVRPFIGETYGFMIYQEQVMQIFDVLARDATSAEAAIFLKVVAKGIARDLEGKQKMQKYYDQFKDGCLDKGMDQKSIDVLWSQILQMSTYSFNKSHSTGYGVNAYLDKYLKKRYPLEFYTNLMSKKIEKISQIIRESRHYGINILPPDINESNEEFTIAGNSIRFGLLGIKDVGPKAIDEIKAKRPFKSYEHFMKKIAIAKVNARVRKALFQAGAFDSMGGRDAWLLNDDATGRISNQVNITQKINWEKERMGFSVSGAGDILKYKDLIEERITYEEDLKNGESALVAGEVINVKEVKTKTGAKMAFVDLDYLNTTYSLTVFPNNYNRYSHMLTDGSTVLAIGDYDEDRHCVVADHICTAEQLYLELNEKR